MASSKKAAIQINNVHLSIDEKQILKGISGVFYEGEITTMVGPSGAGKSTLLKLCNGLLSPSLGEIYIQDELITSYNPINLRRLVGIALQSSPMISGTVLHNLSLPMKLQGKKLAEKNAIELLEDVGMEAGFLHTNIKDLSGGQRQKVSIARTLVNQPQILLLDEITSALDRISQKEIEELIIKINKKYGTTIVWITHNLEQALDVGNYSWVMMEGVVVEMGKSNLLHSSENERVQCFVKGEFV
ncbi:MAG TPA: phosphate ABC transporter ATP-binding protein [Bacillus bacterium]|nr:phosphate ABC transporter ATP-binding protein [Bacillus sp. (in: firmicutes)]